MKLCILEFKREVISVGQTDHMIKKNVKCSGSVHILYLYTVIALEFLNSGIMMGLKNGIVLVQT